MVYSVCIILYSICLWPFSCIQVAMVTDMIIVFCTGFSPSSLNQSLVSMDPAPLGSPLQSGSLINHPGNTFNMSMLAQSRLSQYGQPEVSINHVTLSL